MSKKHDKDFIMSRKYATFVANEYAKRIEKAIEWIRIVQSDKNSQYLEPIINTDELDELLNILQGADKE